MGRQDLHLLLEVLKLILDRQDTSLFRVQSNVRNHPPSSIMAANFLNNYHFLNGHSALWSEFILMKRLKRKLSSSKINELIRKML
jgi:hypothetical protein